MPWCPKCKNEYVEGIRVCADCGEELVDSILDSEADCEELVEEEEPDIIQDSFRPAYMGVYQNSAQKAEENRSSGYMLMILGGLGLLVIILIFLDIIPLPVAMMNKYMICGVMGGLFVLFIVMGFCSLKSSKVLAKKAESEDNLTNEIKKWCDVNLTAEIVDKDLVVEGEDAEEIKYFKRVDRMKQMITYQFMNLDEDFLDSFIEDYYPQLYETEERI